MSIAIKLSKVNKQEYAEFKDLCGKHDIPILKVVVTDDEHEILSLDATVPFSYLDIKYENVMDAYNKLIMRPSDKTNSENVRLMYLLNYAKFTQNDECRRVLCETNGRIIYKQTVADDTTDVFWGMTVPEFIGDNYAGDIMCEIREELKEL